MHQKFITYSTITSIQREPYEIPNNLSQFKYTTYMKNTSYLLVVLILTGFFIISLTAYGNEYNFRLETSLQVQDKQRVVDAISKIIKTNEFSIDQRSLEKLVKNHEILSVYDSSLNLISSSNPSLIISELPKEFSEEGMYHHDEINSFFYICVSEKYIVCMIENKDDFLQYQIAEKMDNFLTLVTISVILFIVIFAGHRLFNSNLNLRKNLEKTNRDLTKKKSELEQLHKAKDDFSAMAAHELRTPLVPIKGYAEMLRSKNETQSDEISSIFSKIYENATRMERLIENIILAQKLENNQMHINRTKFEVDAVFDEVTESFSKNNLKNIQFIKAKNVQINIKSDQDKIQQILTNLILNAIDFVPENDGKIFLDADQKDDKVIFSVRDNGLGISRENIEKLFVKYYQVDNTLTRKHTGFGLGLSICKNIVEVLGGKIWVDSTEGKGATFYFEIPME